ncbi:3909_t:CDS:2 [Funneliformis caledonium]|uniref:3909_t:CDS:1 n=1 Tax=Funneliformis caledonium TaxID=1117310 RepID=A0A9N9C869_9GLOM|nr:3909_t:CDS:2 [Funneliformis caledonium]
MEMETASSPLLTLSVWSSYIAINFTLAFLTYVAHWPPKSWNFWINVVTTTIGTVFNEFPFYIISFKVWMWFAVIIMDAWIVVSFSKSPLILLLAFTSEIFTTSILSHNFYKNYKSRRIVHAYTHTFERYGPELPNITSTNFWLRFMLPIYIPTNVKVFRNITYGTLQELQEIGKENASYLKLDVYVPKHVKKADRRPIMLFIHGGSWIAMDKSIPFPQPFYLSSNGWIVCSINYRLAPKNPYPACLIDCKRALRWIKENIASYGGDPNFVAVSGDSAGGHLAALMSLTANDKCYQPGFEDVDTKVQACACINGVYDVTNKHNAFTPLFTKWFVKEICGKSGDEDEKDVRDMLENASPEILVERKGNNDEKIVPFLVFHGDNDQLVNIKSCREFIKTFRKYSPKSDLVYIEFPGAHHAYHSVSSPRTHYSLIAMLRFLNWVYHTSSSNNITTDFNGKKKLINVEEDKYRFKSLDNLVPII